MTASNIGFVRPIICPAERTFNLSEIGIFAWDDVKSEKYMILSLMTDRPRYHRINLNLKHATMVACSSTAGKSFAPCLIIS
jgi:hypothetical protein